MHRKLNALILAIVLVLSFVTTIGFVKGQSNTASTSTNGITAVDTFKTNLQKSMDLMYLEQLGLASNLTVIRSSVDVNSTSNLLGFSYNANFSSFGQLNKVKFNEFERFSGANVTTDINSTVIGSTNSTINYREFNSTVGNILSSKWVMNQQSTNSSGTYYFNANSNSSTNISSSSISSESTQFNQNYFEPQGNCIINISSQNGSSELSITLPDGTQGMTVIGASANQAYNSLSNGNHISPMLFGIDPWSGPDHDLFGIPSITPPIMTYYINIKFGGHLVLRT